MKFTITSFPSVSTGKEIYPSGITILPSNPTKGVSYLDKFSVFNPNPLYRLGYIISTPFPWSTNILFITKPPILVVTMRESLCDWVVHSKSSFMNSIGLRFNLGFFSSRVSPSGFSTETTLKIPLRWLKFVPIEAACITSITPNGGGSVFPWVLDAYPVALPSGATTNFFKCLDFTNCFKWSLNTLHCLVVCPFF